ncbi:hypothetical protein V1514DRAFT_327979 [Lipomyces japonicus]|uniref:uncharacterized protein n=1 Tax=Lipomyces japonicus TaxID=56871 RepID=UPI0034CE1FA2
MTSTVVLPGDAITLPHASDDDGNEAGTVLQLGAGVRHVPPGSTVVPTRAGTLTSLHRPPRRTIVYVDSASSSSSGNSGPRYVPALRDVVLGTIVGKAGDMEKAYYRVRISNSAVPEAVLHASTGFAHGTSRKTRPNLLPGATVYGRVCGLQSVRIVSEPELECFDDRTGLEAGFGEIKGGMLADISLAYARRLLAPKTVNNDDDDDDNNNQVVTVVDVIGRFVPFEIAVGRNGRIWIDSQSCEVTVAIIRAIQESENLNQFEMEQKVAQFLKNVKK